MASLSDLGEQINSVKDWITIAGRSLTSLYDPNRGVFWFDSIEKKTRGVTTNDHPTSTHRSFYALCEYLRFLNEEGIRKPDLLKTVTEALQGVADQYLIKLAGAQQQESLEASDNRNNMFTDSVMLISVALLDSLNRVLDLKRIDVPTIRRKVKWIANWNEEWVSKWRGGKVREEDEVHDFVTLYAIRGLDAYFGWGTSRKYQRDEQLWRRIEEDVLRQLAFHFSGVSSKFDPSELTFSIALLNRFTTPDTSPITERAVRTIVETQATDGGFPTARIVTHGLLHVASYEVALTLTDLLIRKLYQFKLYQSDMDFCEMLLPALKRAFELVKSYYTSLDDSAGWANDHARRRDPAVESWVTAVVLTFLIHYRDVLFLFRQHSILERYQARTLRPIPHVEQWPDMTQVFRRADWIRSKPITRRLGTTSGLLKAFEDSPLEGISDPTNGAALIKALRQDIVSPVGKSWIHRPKIASLILYGLPGTRKTTLAKKLADALGWPILILSPPNFLQKGGLEGVEACAAEIFADLLRLRRAVILFDEMEDFFKKRSVDQKLESRTIGAFITAGMLPRLQTLHDEQWTIFLLATNSKIGDLDDAVTRLGRFDLRHEMNHPTSKAQIDYVKRSIDLKTPEELGKLSGHQVELKTILRDALRMRGRIPDAGKLPFSILDDLVKEVIRSEDVPTQDEIIETLRTLLDEERRSSLVK